MINDREIFNNINLIAESGSFMCHDREGFDKSIEIIIEITFMDTFKRYPADKGHVDLIYRHFMRNHKEYLDELYTFLSV